MIPASPLPSGTVGQPSPEPTPPPLTPGRLAPDDTGPADRHHLFQLRHDGTHSEFVWVPRFTAWQLIRPADCGQPDKPVGYWVGTRPEQGESDLDWAEETFGGFYVAKYEASRLDGLQGSTGSGASATAGSSIVPKSQPMCVPWTMVDFDEAIAACQRLGPAGHLMRDEEWTACAVWSQIHGITVRGNSGLGEDLEDPDLTFVADPTYPDGRVLTGSGRKVGLTAGQDPTSHTGTTEGVVDLNGNVNEWTLDLGVDTQDRLTYGSFILGTAPGRGYVGLLETSATKRRLGLGIAAQSGSPWFGNDYLERAKVRQDIRCMRGGHWGENELAGVWCVFLNCLRTFRLINGGFRPCLRYE
ncbi:MAG: hypothetical protein VKP57_06535 [Candidatus Sericytochromatia bacterium]|nr:hypothetical protein [Candidatus Sericytochromatia bacterium]